MVKRIEKEREKVKSVVLKTVVDKGKDKTDDDTLSRRQFVGPMATQREKSNSTFNKLSSPD